MNKYDGVDEAISGIMHSLAVSLVQMNQGPMSNEETQDLAIWLYYLRINCLEIKLVSMFQSFTSYHDMNDLSEGIDFLFTTFQLYVIATHMKI